MKKLKNDLLKNGWLEVETGVFIKGSVTIKFKK